MKQKPFTKQQLSRLIANGLEAAENGGNSQCRPVVKFFCPWGAGTWLISEYDGEDALFGLCDSGQGSPGLGYVSLSELRAAKGPFGLTIERDLHFTADKRLIDYADEARAEGRIIA